MNMKTIGCIETITSRDLTSEASYRLQQQRSLGRKIGQPNVRLLLSPSAEFKEQLDIEKLVCYDGLARSPYQIASFASRPTSDIMRGVAATRQLHC